MPGPTKRHQPQTLTPRHCEPIVHLTRPTKRSATPPILRYTRSGEGRIGDCHRRGAADLAGLICRLDRPAGSADWIGSVRHFHDAALVGGLLQQAGGDEHAGQPLSEGEGRRSVVADSVTGWQVAPVRATRQDGCSGRRNSQPAVVPPRQEWCWAGRLTCRRATGPKVQRAS